MTTLAFFSAKGAPGTTTTAMLVASLWPRPVLLVDGDPYGGDVGLRLPSPDGRPLDLFQGMLSLLPVARRTLEPEALLDHVQPTLGGGEVIVGLSGPEQAAAGGPVWSTLADAFAGLTGHDVIMDIGRLDSRSPVLPLALSAQVVVCVVQASLSGVYASRARLRTLLPSLVGMDGAGPTIGIIVQSTSKAEADGAAAVILGEFPAIAYFGHLITDPNGARIFDGLPVSRPERTLLVRSGAQLVAALTQELDRRLAARTRRLEATTSVEPPPVGTPTRTRSEARAQAKRKRFSRSSSSAGSGST
jgi:hypothetical protein